MTSTLSRTYDRVFVGNEWVEPAQANCVEVINPATEKSIGSAVLAGVPETEAAIDAAHQAFENGPWPRMSADERADVLEKFCDLTKDKKLDIVSLIVAETGHSFAISIAVHFDMAMDIVGFQLKAARSDFTETHPVVTAPNPFDMGATSLAGGATVVRKPLGVVAAITPFNAPFMLNMLKIIPAMAMGNTVVLKTSEITPLQGLILGQIAIEAGLPMGVLNIIPGGPEVGQCLSTDPRVAAISFTGSDLVGSTIMGQAAPTLKRLMLELGGKSASIVCRDAALNDAALFGSINAITMSGQGCGLCTRHIVDNAVIDDYVEALQQRLWGFPIGDPANPYNQMGPLISAGQRTRAENFVQMARDEGGSVAFGGRRPEYLDKGFFFEPTIITGLSNSSQVSQKEIFGPVISVMGFDTEDEAINIANDTPYGLSGAVFSRNRGKAFEMAQQMETGYTYINATAIAASPSAPFGGVKRSGFGKEWGVAGLLEFTSQQTISYPIG